MRWPADAENWPLRAYSRQILHRPHRWHVQEHGQGDTLLLIHGAGGATQSFRHLFPLLAATHHVIAIDLPGQGFSENGAPQRCGLDHMATDIHSLCQSQGWMPKQIIGHSAGAAIALRLWEIYAQGQGFAPDRIIGINAALANFQGVAGWLFPVMAKALAITPFSANLFAATTTRNSLRRLIDGTGSTLDIEGLDLYYRLATDRAHVAATLSMMAQWSLDGLLGRLGSIDVPVHLIVGMADLAVPPKVSQAAASRLPQAQVTELPGLGHLAHEEDAATVAGLISGKA